MNKEIEKVLSELYHSLKSDVSFSSPLKLYRAAKLRIPDLKLKVVKNWLSKDLTYTLHHPIRRSYTTRRVLVHYIDEQWQADLADLQNLSKFNKGYRYLLVCIDILSKFAWIRPLKKKTGKEVEAAFRDIFSKGRKPLMLQTDRGKEFLDGRVQKMFKEHDIKFYTTFSERKASVVERFNRTIKGLMYKYFSRYETRKYVDVLQELVSRYNNGYHRSIKMKPSDVNKENELQAWMNLYSGKSKRVNKKVNLTVGDHVRITLERGTFHKGYLEGWSEEIFIISHKLSGDPVVFKVKDQAGESVDGIFYLQELQKVSEPDAYKIEKIIKRKIQKDGSWIYLVKWKGYPEKFNSFVNKEDIQSLKK